MIDSALIVAIDHSHTNSPLLPDRPTILWPVLGRPMIFQAMEPLYRLGIRIFTILIDMSASGASDQLQRRWMPDAKIKLTLKMSHETLATAIVRVASAMPNEQPIFLMAYNTFLDNETLETLAQQIEHHPLNLVTMPSDEQELVSIATLHKDAISSLAAHNQPTNLTALLKDTRGSIVGVKSIRANWAITIKNERDLLELNTHLLADMPDSYILSELYANVRIVPPVRIDPQVSIGQGAVIGPNVYLERGTRIGYQAQIENALILDRGSIDANQSLSHAILTRSGQIQLN